MTEVPNTQPTNVYCSESIMVTWQELIKATLNELGRERAKEIANHIHNWQLYRQKHPEPPPAPPDTDADEKGPA